MTEEEIDQKVDKMLAWIDRRLIAHDIDQSTLQSAVKDLHEWEKQARAALKNA